MSVTVGKEPHYEELDFYKGEIRVLYDDDAHIYYLVKDGQRIELESVTQVLKIIDKSDMLVPWSSKVAIEKLLKNVATFTTKDGRTMVSATPYEVFLTLAMDAKSAHRDKLEDAANVGKEAHKWIESCIKKELGQLSELSPKPEEPRALSCCNAALDWMAAHQVKWLLTERKVYSRKYNYIGTLDGLCYASACTDNLCCPESFKDRITVVDWKSSNALRNEYLLQTAAYFQALMEEYLEHQ